MIGDARSDPVSLSVVIRRLAQVSQVLRRLDTFALHLQICVKRAIEFTARRACVPQEKIQAISARSRSHTGLFEHECLKTATNNDSGETNYGLACEASLQSPRAPYP